MTETNWASVTRLERAIELAKVLHARLHQAYDTTCVMDDHGCEELAALLAGRPLAPRVVARFGNEESDDIARAAAPQSSYPTSGELWDAAGNYRDCGREADEPFAHVVKNVLPQAFAHHREVLQMFGKHGESGSCSKYCFETGFRYGWNSGWLATRPVETRPYRGIESMARPDLRVAHPRSEAQSAASASGWWDAEWCKRCDRRNVVGFNVTDEVWNVVVRGRWNVLCPSCFDEEAQLANYQYEFTALWCHKLVQHPIPMVLHCPECRTRHIDVGDFETKPHHTHACQDCGMVWRPAIGPTVGVRYLPGFKDGDAAGPCIQTVNIHGYRLREKCSDITFSGKHDREGCTGAGASCLHHRPLYAPAAQEGTAG